MSVGKVRWLAPTPENEEGSRTKQSPDRPKTAEERAVGNSTFTTMTEGTEFQREQNQVSTPSGSSYLFRAKPGEPSQWISLHTKEDLRWFRKRDQFEVKVS